MTDSTLTRLATPGPFSTVGARQVEVVVSDPSIARDGASIVTAGIKYDDWLGYGGTVLFSHDPSRPVARAVKVWTVGTKLMALIQFPAEGTSDDSDMVYRLIKENVVNATSIGFIVTKRTPLQGGGYRFDSIDLLECSFVAVPALPSAVITARSAKRAGKVLSGKNEGHVRAAVDHLQAVLSDVEPPENGDDDGDEQAERARRANAARLAAQAEDERRELARQRALAEIDILRMTAPGSEHDRREKARKLALGEVQDLRLKGTR